ncbi:MAG TPA: response regulator [Sphingobacteriaceae bacterium]
MYTSVIIIDDYPINLRIAEMVIKRNGFFDKVSSYSDAERALCALLINYRDYKYLPNVILLDLQMPCMDGWQFLDKFEDIKHSLVKHIHIFILTSSLNDRDIQRSKQYPSVNKFFSKPLTQDMLNEIQEIVRLASVS